MALFFWPILASHIAYARLNASLEMGLNYADDAALFSVTRRLSLKDDPTQPTVDRPGIGGDFIYDPRAILQWNGSNRFGKTRVGLDAGAYVFTEHTEYSHGLFEVLMIQGFGADTTVAVHYNVVPDLYLGQNRSFRSNSDASEEVSSHYASLRIDHALSREFTLSLYSRYGVRDYSPAFVHRNLVLWTVGPHLEWSLGPSLSAFTGYHFERGNVDARSITDIPDDISYINHYGSIEVRMQLLDRLRAIAIFDFEQSDFPNRFSADDQEAMSERLYQSEVELIYQVDRNMALKLGWEHGRRKLRSEPTSVHNNNVWLHLDYRF